MAAHTLKSLRVLKVRKQLADEGKNHAASILVEMAKRLRFKPRAKADSFGVPSGPRRKILCAAA
jgi:hypothetical protein